MTVILEQVETTVPAEFAKCLDIAYADDTTLIAEDPAALEVVFHKLLEVARAYGLEPNLDKTIHMQVRHSSEILDPLGAAVKTADTVKYLGGILSANGSCTSAVIARIGEAKSAFATLEAIWKHSRLTQESNFSGLCDF